MDDYILVGQFMHVLGYESAVYQSSLVCDLPLFCRIVLLLS